MRLLPWPHGQAGGLDVAQLPGCQKTDKKQYRQTHPPSQRLRHARAPVLARPVFAHHEKQRHTEADQNGYKSKQHEYFHEIDYPVTPGKNLHLDVRFWLLTAAAVATMAATAALGRWQLDRATQKEALHAAIEARSHLLVLDGASLGAPSVAEADIAALLHRRVLLRGRWLPDHTVFLDNRQMQGRVGFFVITPLQLSQGAGVVLVQRGWVPRNFQDRTALPAIDTPTGPVQIVGRVALPPSRLYAPGGDTPTQEASRIRQNIDVTAFRTETGLLPANITVLQTDAASGGLQRDWPAIHTGVEKHYGYAFQWFGLCTLVGLLYVWFQLVPRFLRARRRTAA